MTDATLVALAAPKASKKAAPKAKKPADHPKYEAMIKDALTALKERGGSSRVAVLKYIMAHNNLNGQDEKAVNAHLKMALRAGVKSGALKQSKGTGAAGSFKIGVDKEPKKPKASATSSAKKPKKAVSGEAKKPKVAKQSKSSAKKQVKSKVAEPKVAKATTPKVTKGAALKAAKPKVEAKLKAEKPKKVEVKPKAAKAVAKPKAAVKK